MKMKFKSVIVISLIFTILFGMLPTVSLGVEKTDEYLEILGNYANKYIDASMEEQEVIAFDCMEELLGVWYGVEGEDNLDLSVKETTTTDSNGNLQKEYTLVHADGKEGYQILQDIVWPEIKEALKGKEISYGPVGEEATFPADDWADIIYGDYSNIKLYVENEDHLINYLIQREQPDAQVDSSHVQYVPPADTDNPELLGMALTGIARVVYQPLKWIVFLLPGGIIQLVIEGIANLDGGNSGIATLDRILFNEVKITNANIFNTANAGNNMSKIRKNIANWYNALRNLSIVISLCMLIYIGVRMAISSVAEKKAEYKEMLKNWFMGMVILFLLHYFMVIILNVNDALVQAVRGAMQPDDSYTNLVAQLLENSLKVNVIKSTAAAICFLMLQGLTFGYLIVYIKRMLTISLLTCVAPLITTTYAMDKVGDKKSQVLNTWIKEYSYNVLMQPFQCIIYVVFVKNALDILAKTPTSFAAAIMAVMCMSFMIVSEGIVKAIFGLQGNTMSSAASSVAAFAAGATTAANFSQRLNGKVKDAEKKISDNVKATGEMSKKMPKIENKVDKNAAFTDKAKAVGSKAMQGAGKVAGAAKKLYLNPKLTGIQTAMVSGALGLATGDAGTALHSARAGKSAGDTLGAHMSERDKRRQVSRNESMFERQFDEYQIRNPEANMKELTANILAGGKVPEGMEHYAASAIGLRDTYKIDGKEDPIQAVLDNIDDLKKYE